MSCFVLLMREYEQLYNIIELNHTKFLTVNTFPVELCLIKTFFFRNFYLYKNKLLNSTGYKQKNKMLGQKKNLTDPKAPGIIISSSFYLSSLMSKTFPFNFLLGHSFFLFYHHYYFYY